MPKRAAGILAGLDDPIVPPINARIMARLLPHAQLQMIDCGHLFIVTCAAQVATLVSDFLKTSDDPARQAMPRSKRDRSAPGAA